MSYNDKKQYGGRFYTGMEVNTGHRWNYMNGIWTEIKYDPENYNIEFDCQKHRIGFLDRNGKWQNTELWPNKPGSGAAVGTKYRYAILAVQEVEKISCSDYKTHMTGEKVIVDYQYPNRDWSSKYQEEMEATRNLKVMEAYDRFSERIYPRKLYEPEQQKLVIQ